MGVFGERFEEENQKKKKKKIPRRKKRFEEASERNQFHLKSLYKYLLLIRNQEPFLAKSPSSNFLFRVPFFLTPPLNLTLFPSSPDSSSLILSLGFVRYFGLGMRVEEEEDNMVPQGNEADGEMVLDTASSQHQEEKLVIGYALTSKKKQSFLQPKLEVLAR